uniref:Uncharacterized protein n=1 Tax=Trieres chinensis TaxID=1514140 RepID=A0A7S1YWE7_TRICV
MVFTTTFHYYLNMIASLNNLQSKQKLSNHLPETSHTHILALTLNQEDFSAHSSTLTTPQQWETPPLWRHSHASFLSLSLIQGQSSSHFAPSSTFHYYLDMIASTNLQNKWNFSNHLPETSHAQILTLSQPRSQEFSAHVSPLLLHSNWKQPTLAKALTHILPLTLTHPRTVQFTFCSLVLTNIG